MEATVDKLETMFQKADADLDYLSRKLDSEFSNNDEHGVASVEKQSPAKMLQKIGEIKKEYAEIVKEAEAIRDAQKEAMDFFRNELMMVCETLGRLQQNVGMEQPPEPEEMARVSAILGIEVPISTANGATGYGPSNSAKPEDVTSSAAASAVNGLADKENSTPVTNSKDSEADQLTLSPFDKRSDTSEFIEINEAEFNSTSALIRGRVKLSDVNQAYRILWTHFKENGNTKTLTPQDMHKMGLRVTGQTGEAKLKVLRALKLLTISNKGEVTML